MGFFQWMAIGAGAVAGTWLRAGLGILLNPVFPPIPLGTLAVNLIGGYLMGAAMVIVEKYPMLPPEVRLAVITGFLGGMTTFSAFSGEAVTLLSKQEYAWGGVLIFGHVAGSLAMTALGILTLKWVIRQGLF